MCVSTGGKVNVLEVSKKMSGYEVSYGNHDDIASPTGMHAYTVVNIPLCKPPPSRAAHARAQAQLRCSHGHDTPSGCSIPCTCATFAAARAAGRRASSPWRLGCPSCSCCGAMSTRRHAVSHRSIARRARRRTRKEDKATRHGAASPPHGRPRHCPPSPLPSPID